MPPLSVKIFAREGSPRLNYIAGIILGDILGLTFETVTDRRKIGKHPVINYSTENIKGSFKIDPVTLLFETDISQKEIVITSWNNLPVFFKSSDSADLPFDIFAASFFMVSRYEEYLDNKSDEHGRFCAYSSIAFKNGFLDKPVVEMWVKEFSRMLLKKFQTLAFRRNEFRSLLTIDSDQPFAYLGKNLLVSAGGMIRDMAMKKDHASERYKVMKHERKDPYEVYDYILGTIEKHGTEASFFFPTGDFSRYDKNPSWKSREYRDLIKKIAASHSIGIHPSYHASDKRTLLHDEYERLKTITGREITISRFHFLRLSLPSSYLSLTESGIREDYTMGFHDEPGFRAGIARPFPFFDIRGNRQMSIKVFPLMVMDTTLFKYKNLGPSAAEVIISNLIADTRRVGGLFISLWHNTSLLETDEWKGWRDVFENMLKEQQP